MNDEKCCNGQDTCTNPLGLTKEEVERRHEILFRVARLGWAAMLLIAELITSEPANWRKDSNK